MIRILHDTDEGYPFLSELLPGQSIRHFSPKIKQKCLSWIAGSWNILRLSKKNDIIICVYDFQAILCYWLGILTFRRRKILAINLLLKLKNSWRNKIATYLYKVALKSDNFIATVTTEDYGNRMLQHLKINKPFPVLRDVFYSSYLREFSTFEGDGSVFCGGRNGRDWDFMFRLASMMPDIHFNIVAPKTIFKKNLNIPQNLTLLSEIPYEEFENILAKSSVVALPLDTEAPAGLIVLFQAAALKKPLIITDTISSRAYISDDRGYALENNLPDWVDTISSILQNPEIGRKKAETLLEFLKTECSEFSFINGIEKIIQPWLTSNQQNPS